jgi:hypothetical protein
MREDGVTHAVESIGVARTVLNCSQEFTGAIQSFWFHIIIEE